MQRRKDTGETGHHKTDAKRRLADEHERPAYAQSLVEVRTNRERFMREAKLSVLVS